MRVCKNNYTDILRKNFGANPLLIPSEAHQPMTLLEVENKRPRIIGKFRDLIEGDFDSDIEVESSAMAEFSGEHTKATRLKTGLELLGNFIRAFGVNPAKIEGGLNQSKKISFAFESVQRIRIDELALAKITTNGDIKGDMNNPIVKRIMANKKHQLAMIVEAFVSNNFSIATFDDSDREVDINIPLIQDALSNGSGNVTAESHKSNVIKFKNSQPLTFAFTCIEMGIESDTGSLLYKSSIANLREKGFRGQSTVGDNRSGTLKRLLFDDDENRPLLI